MPLASILLLAFLAACAAPTRGAPPADASSRMFQGSVAAGAEGGIGTGGEPLDAAHRPMPITRPLEAYLGRPIWIGAAGAAPEQWLLREIGQDHVTLERTRTYRVLPVRRIAEITWTDLTGIDPTPRVVLGPE